MWTWRVLRIDIGNCADQGKLFRSRSEQWICHNWHFSGEVLPTAVSGYACSKRPIASCFSCFLVRLWADKESRGVPPRPNWNFQVNPRSIQGQSVTTRSIGGHSVNFSAYFPSKSGGVPSTNSAGLYVEWPLIEILL